jgi:hypothetical protein
MLQQNKDQENVRVRGKDMVVGAPPAATKRSALAPIQNDRAACRGLAARKVGGNKQHATLKK